jgi:hypothetical protein
MLLLVATVSAQAQVTIGDLKNPEPFSILELVSGSGSNNGNRGLRLPQLTTVEREAMVFTGYETEALGLQIFNRSTRCVETWNGTKWIQSCGKDGPRPLTGQVAISISGTDITYRDFMAYNLGAQELSIKEQLLHDITVSGLTENQNPAQSYTPAQKDAYTKVYGSKYQWGRQSDGHENVWSSVTSSVGVIDDHIDPNTGQVLEGEDEYGLFIKSSSSTSKYDWYTTFGSQPYWNRPGRWDGGDQNSYSGTPFAPFTSNSKVTSDKGVDPCPAGFRVPSRAEWEGIFTGGTWSGSVYSGINKWVWVAKNTNIFDLTGFSEETGIVKTSGYLIYPAAEASGGSVTFYYETPTLFLPTVGYRYNDSNSNLYNAGSSGFYWSSTAYSDTGDAGSYLLYFSSGGVYPTSNSIRSGGISVRCVAD